MSDRLEAPCFKIFIHPSLEPCKNRKIKGRHRSSTDWCSVERLFQTSMAEDVAPVLIFQEESRPQPPRWLIVLPTVMTLGNALCGFAALVVLRDVGIFGDDAASWEPLRLAGYLILVASVFDMLDGFVARLTRTNSTFGAQLDSLCDAVGFGVAPAYLIGLYWERMGLMPALPWVGWIIGGLFLMAVLLRLARFNVEDPQDELGHLYFKGMPSPAAASLVAALAITVVNVSGGYLGFVVLPAGLAIGLTNGLQVLLPALGAVVAGLMVSSACYADWPKHYLRKLQPRWHVAILCVVAVLMGIGPAVALMYLCYAATPLAQLLFRRVSIVKTS